MFAPDRRDGMRINMGKSYKNGFDIWVSYGKKKYVINAIRDENENTRIDCNDKPRNQKIEPSFKKTILLLIFSIVMSLLYNYFSSVFDDSIVRVILVISLWISGYIGVWLYSINNKNTLQFKYHAVEHMVMRYYENNKNAPKDIQDLAKENEISITCGSTLSVLVLMIISMVFIIIPFLPHNFFFKIMCILLAIIFPVSLWIHDKLNFIQKLLVKAPTNKELELGLMCLNMLYEMKAQYEKEMKYYGAINNA